MNPHAQTTVSLIIPSFNRGDLIGETIDSALAQTTPFHEIIVVDDGSSDDTMSVLAGYGDRIILIQQTHQGVQVARNAGVARASGRYIVLCDSDDLLEPAFLASAVEAVRMRPETDAFYCNFCTFTDGVIHDHKFARAPEGYFDGARRENGYMWDVPDLYARTVTFQPLFISGCMVRKSFYEQLGGFDEHFNNVGGEDWEFTLRCLAQGQITIAESPLVRIRKHAHNESADPIRQVRGTAHILEHALKAHPQAEKYRNHIRESIEDRRLSVFHVAFSYGKFEIAEEMLTLLKQKPRGLTSLFKRAILGLPGWLRTPIWKLTQ